MVFRFSSTNAAALVGFKISSPYQMVFVNALSTLSWMRVFRFHGYSTAEVNLVNTKIKSCNFNVNQKTLLLQLFLLWITYTQSLCTSSTQKLCRRYLLHQTHLEMTNSSENTGCFFTRLYIALIIKKVDRIKNVKISKT